MTLLVGILCEDGVVVGTDSASTSSTLTGQYTVATDGSQKLWSIGQSLLWCGTGSVGAIQEMRHALEKDYAAKGFANKGPAIQVMKEVAGVLRTAIDDRVRSVNTGAAVFKNDGGACSAASLLAGVVEKAPVLYEFSMACHGEMKSAAMPFVAMGSGQMTADPLLAFFNRVLWRKQRPKLSEARLVAAWTINHCIQMTPGGIGGSVQLGTVSVAGGAPKVEMSSAEEHLEHASNLEEHLREFFTLPPRPAASTEPPKMPAKS